jgi:hypothetical protein
VRFVRNLLEAIWDPTTVTPKARHQFNTWTHRLTVFSLVPVTVFVWVVAGPAVGLLMLLSFKTDLGTTYGNVQMGDVRVKQEEA